MNAVEKPPSISCSCSYVPCICVMNVEEEEEEQMSGHAHYHHSRNDDPKQLIERPKSRLRMLLESNTETQCPLCMFIPCLCPPEEEECDMEDILSNKSTRTDQANSSEETVEGSDDNDDDDEEEEAYSLIDQYGRVPLEEDSVIMVPYEIRRCLKPHQIEGVRFMYHHLEANRGCILADYMGLGKTLQVISVIYSFLTDQLKRQPHEPPSTVMVLCPAICIPNWEAEFKKWLSIASLKYCPIHLLDSSSSKSSSTLSSSSLRLKILQQWKKQGGVLLMGYEMYRSLLNPSFTSSTSSLIEREASIQITSRLGLTSSTLQITDGISSKNQKKSVKEFERLLCQPGADLVVLDEGHRMKDPCSLLCQSVARIKTQKRLVLTGYPVQNSLSEYWCMVNFARPNFLGLYETFRSQYEKPILEGKEQVSQELVTRLKDVVLRRGKELLQKQLPPKKEWILYCKLSTIQHQLYCDFLESYGETEGKATADLLTAYAVLLQVMNHPDIIHSKLYQGLSSSSSSRVQQEEDEVGGDFGIGGSSTSASSSTATTPRMFLNGQASEQDGWGWIPQEKQVEKQLIAVEQSRKRKQKRNDQQKAYEWARAVIDGVTTTTSAGGYPEPSPQVRPMLYETQVLENSGKMAVLMHIIEQSFACGDKVVVFSQSVPTLKVIKEFLYCTRHSPFRHHQDFEKRRRQLVLNGQVTPVSTSTTGGTTKKRKTLAQMNGNERQRARRDPAGLLRRRGSKGIFSPKIMTPPNTPTNISSSGKGEGFQLDTQEPVLEWCLQIDGTTSGPKRAEYIQQFSSPTSGVQVLLVSTKAGAEGINLHVANRLVLFDVSWNPSHDHQSMCRSHRIGQSKTVHVYRLVSDGTMERMIYEQQMKKVDLSTCVVDEQKKASTPRDRISPKNLGAKKLDTPSTPTTATLKDFLERPGEISLEKKKKQVEIHPDLLEDDHVLKACIQEVGHWLVDIHPVHEIEEIEEEPAVEEVEKVEERKKGVQKIEKLEKVELEK